MLLKWLFLFISILSLSRANCDKHLAKRAWSKDNYQALSLFLDDYRLSPEIDELQMNNLLTYRHKKLEAFLKLEKIIYQKEKRKIIITPIKNGHLFNQIAYELKANFDVDYIYDIFHLYNSGGQLSMAMVNQVEKTFHASYETYELWDKIVAVNFLHEFVHLWLGHAQARGQSFTPLSFQMVTDEAASILSFLSKSFEPKTMYPKSSFYDAEELLTYLSTIYSVLGLPESKLNDLFFSLESDIAEIQELLFYNLRIIDYFKKNKHDYVANYYADFEGKPVVILHTKDDLPAAIEFVLPILKNSYIQSFEGTNAMAYVFWFFEQYEKRAEELEHLRKNAFNWLIDYENSPKKAKERLPTLRRELGNFLRQELFGSPDKNLSQDYKIFRNIFEK